MTSKESHTLSKHGASWVLKIVAVAPPLRK